MQNDFRRKQQRISRKRYKCHLCGQDILSEKEYIYESVKYNGFINTFHRHIHCDAMLEACLTGDWPENEWDEDGVTEFLYEKLCKQICNEDQRDECSMLDLYGCELCQRKLLNPATLQAAIQSTRENHDWDNE